MSYLKISADQFLETQELNRLQEMLIRDGFKQDLLLNTETFGIVKGFRLPIINITSKQVFEVSPAFGNLVNIAAGRAIDADGNIITSGAITDFTVPNTSVWYWMKIAYQISNDEAGTVSIDVDGNITGLGTEFLKVLRGQPNMPQKIKFKNSTLNTGEYNVLYVNSDTVAILSGGSGVFQVETGLIYQVVGCFTPGFVVDPANKLIFNYDSMQLTLVPEVTLDTAPVKNIDFEFYIARVMYDGLNLFIEDKRTEYWKTKAGYEIKYIDRSQNIACIGVESVKWDIDTTTRDRNIATVSWGFKSSNWTIDPVNKIINLNGGSGGKFKDPSYFATGDFDNWRIYAKDGSYQKVISSTKIASSINLQLDCLILSDYAPGDVLSIVPDYEEITIVTTPDFSASPDLFKIQTITHQTFKVAEVSNVVHLPVIDALNPYKFCFFYSYGTYKETSIIRNFPNDPVGHWTEKSFSEQGNLLPTPSGNTIAQNIIDGFLMPYVASATVGFIQVVPNPDNYAALIDRIYLGDLLGVENYDLNLMTPPVKRLVVGTDRQYQRFIGAPFATLADTFLNLENYQDYPLTNILNQNGNFFLLHFKQVITNTSGVFRIVKNYVDPVTYDTLYELDANDLAFIKSSPEGLFLRCTFDGAQWIVNHVNEINTDAVGTVKMYFGNLSVFSGTDGLGSDRAWLGWALCNGSNGTPDLRGRFIAGYAPADPDYDAIGKIGGQKEMPQHSHSISDDGEHTHTYQFDTSALAVAGDKYMFPGSGESASTDAAGEHNHGGNTGTAGTGATADDNRPPFYTLAFVMRIN
jgi:hypothetical protein